MSDHQDLENGMVLEGAMEQARLDRIPQEEEGEERPENCRDCQWVREDKEGWLYCEYQDEYYDHGSRSLPPSLKGKPPDWCPWEEE